MPYIMAGICLALALLFYSPFAAAWTLAVFGLWGLADILTRVEKHLRTLAAIADWWRMKNVEPPKPEGPACPPGPSVFRADTQPEYPSPTLPSSASGSKNPRSR